MNMLERESDGYENLRMSLTGGAATRAWFNSVRELAGTDKPYVTVDNSALIGSELYWEYRKNYQEFFEKSDIPTSWLQKEPDTLLDADETLTTLEASDVLLVMGGSTDMLYRRWQEAGVLEVIVRKVLSGDIVATGMSAGAMIWFERGFSDSESFVSKPGTIWNYRMVPGTNVLPGWITPHYSDLDGFDRLRSKKFEEKLGALAGQWEVALGLDSCSALVIAEGVASVVDANMKDHNKPANVYKYSSNENAPQVLMPGTAIDLSEMLH